MKTKTEIIFKTKISLVVSCN